MVKISLDTYIFSKLQKCNVIKNNLESIIHSINDDPSGSCSKPSSCINSRGHPAILIGHYSYKYYNYHKLLSKELHNILRQEDRQTIMLKKKFFLWLTFNKSPCLPLLESNWISGSACIDLYPIDLISSHDYFKNNYNSIIIIVKTKIFLSL